MASIQERTSANGKKLYKVTIRLKGCDTQTASFGRKTDAKQWAQANETAIRENRYFKSAQAKKHTLGDTIDRYVLTVMPNKKSHRDQFRYL